MGNRVKKRLNLYIKIVKKMKKERDRVEIREDVGVEEVKFL